MQIKFQPQKPKGNKKYGRPESGRNIHFTADIKQTWFERELDSE
jgi:hypothetical protein